MDWEAVARKLRLDLTRTLSTYEYDCRDAYTWKERARAGERLGKNVQKALHVGDIKTALGHDPDPVDGADWDPDPEVR